MTQVGQRLDPLQRTRGVFYGWWLVGIAGVVLAITTAPLWISLSIWGVALERHFGWSRTQFSLAFVFSRVEGGFMGPLEGYFTDRMGTRRMVLIGLGIMGAGFLLFSRTQNLWMFYVAFLVLMLGNGIGGWIPIMTVLNNWFRRRRATAMGWALVGQRLGALLLVPLIAWAIDPDAERFGWRVTAAAIGVIILMLAIPIYLALRNRPEEYGQQPDGDLPATSAPLLTPQESLPASAEVEELGFTVGEALRTPAFWFMSLGHGFTAMLIGVVLAHLALNFYDQDISVQTSAWVIAVYTSVSVVFQIVGGYLGDRVPPNVGLFVFSSFMGGSVLAITLAHSVPMAFIFAVTFGIGYGGRSSILPAIRGDYFGRKSFATILGISQIPLNFFMLTGPLIAGVYRDHWGNYDLPFNIAVGFCLLGAVCFLMARKPASPTFPGKPNRGQSS